MDASWKRIAVDACALVAFGAVAWAFEPERISFLDLPLAVLATVLLPVLLAERRLVRHLAGQRASIERASSLSPEARELALSVCARPTIQLAARVVGVLGLTFLAYFLEVTVEGLMELAESGKGGPLFGLEQAFANSSLWESLRPARELGLAQIVYSVPLIGYLHLFGRALRRHESLLWRTTLPAAEAELRCEQASDDWAQRYSTDALLSIAALVPVVGWPAVVAVAVRPSGALELHERHESEREPG